MKRIKTISRTPLFKVTSLNSISILIKISTGLIISKVLAIFIGPGGMALVGNLRNFLTATETITTLGFQNGIVRYIVMHKEDERQLPKIIATVFICLISVTLLVSAVLFAFASYWNNMIFGTSSDYGIIFKILALVLPWYATTVFLLAVMNGLGKFRNVIFSTIFGNVLGLVFSAVMIWKFQTFGALLSIIIPPSLLFFVAFYYLNKDIRFTQMISFEAFDVKVIQNLSGYSLMALVSSLCGPLVFIAIRNNVIDRLGLEPAGYWEAMNRISTYHMMFISSILPLYFFPKLAAATTNKATRNVIKSYYTGIFSLFVIGMVVLYFLRYFIVNLLFTSAFVPVAGLFFWQLLGDVFKAASLIMGYQFFAKKLVLAFVLTEIFSLTLMYAFSHFFIVFYGIEGVVMAHALTYFIYFLVLAIYFRKSLF